MVGSEPEGEGVGGRQGWAFVLFKRRHVFAFFSILFKRTKHSLRSFTFFIKERSVFCVLYIRMRHSLRSFMFYKRTQRSLRSFMFFIKERKRELRSFWFHKSYKNDKSRKNKKCKRTPRSFLRLKKNETFFFALYIYIYISYK